MPHRQPPSTPSPILSAALALAAVCIPAPGLAADPGPAALRSVLELGSALYSLHPAFGEARVLRLAAALRPAFNDHRPALRHHEGVWQINGLYRHGYLCGPALVAQLVEGVSR